MEINEVKLAGLCGAVYHDDLSSTAFDEFDSVIPIVHRSSEAVALVKGDTLFVICRGTELKDLSDLKAVAKSLFKREHPWGRVHRGFSQYSDRIITSAFTIAHQIQPKKVVCAGHSLGGAMAVLLASAFKIHWRSDIDLLVYTIGCPRIGNKEFVDQYRKELGDVTHQFFIRTDFVTHLPPRFWPFRYKHAVTGTHIKVGMSALHRSFFAVCLALIRKSLGYAVPIDKPLRAISRKLGLTVLSDHSVWAYTEALISWEAERRNNGEGFQTRLGAEEKIV